MVLMSLCGANTSTNLAFSVPMSRVHYGPFFRVHVDPHIRPVELLLEPLSQITLPKPA
jgi:hypothetical protein